MEVSLRRFRTLLTEIDVVLRGLISQKEQLPRLKDGRAAEIAEQLGVLHEHLGLDQESIWPIEVTDTWTRVLIEKVTDELPTVDEIALATQYIDTIRGLLSVLSHIREETAPRDGNVPRPVFANAGPDAKNLNRKLLAYEAVNGRIRLRSAPLRHVVHTTTRCNLRCLTCFQSASQDFLHYDIADASRAALKPSVLLAQQVMVAGTGEPLLSRSARLLIAEYKQAGAYVEVITNGTKLALQSDLLDDVDVLLLSFDGGTERSYNAIRRGGNFKRSSRKSAICRRITGKRFA